ncbi:MAG: hypothetical protein WCG11_03160 [Methylococcaceae bacterium]|jgi:hypothetical protein
MLIRVALGLFAGCLAVFLLAKLLLAFAFFIIAAFAIKFAVFLLFGAFFFLVITAILGVINHLFQAMKNYFSHTQREQRRLVFMANQQANAHRLFYFQRLQVTYFKERLRKKALEKDNHAHISALGAAIELDLQRSKQLLPKAVFRQLKRKNRLYRMQQNAKALLELHHQIATLIGK